ncbi:MAG: hypothetical protein P1V81_13430 [Planctomycetota bacterium]|nr:hypothetical protein [Planctomycetota bacterium]
MQRDRPRRAWVLNLDAEHELEARGSYAPTRRLADIVARQSGRLLGSLVPPGDLVVDARDPGTESERWRVREVGPEGRVLARWADRAELDGLELATWLPTPTTARLVRGSGLIARPGPGLEVLRRVNSRPFAVATRAGLVEPGRLPGPMRGAGGEAGGLGREEGRRSNGDAWREVGRDTGSGGVGGCLGGGVRGDGRRDLTQAVDHDLDRDHGRGLGCDWSAGAHAAFAKHVALDLEATLECLAAPAPLGWLVRRTFGAAGRGRRRLKSGRPTAAELAWLVASLAKGPLVIEPWVEVTTEFTRSGLVREDGSVDLSAPCFQETTATGAWSRTERAGAGEVTRADDEELSRAVEAAGLALASAGYHGPFGIDAFRYRDPTAPGRTILNPMSEINARYTMDWALAMDPSAGEG